MSVILTLRYEFSRDDDFGWLGAKVRTAKVCGAGGFWVQWQDVEEWAAKLAACPLSGPVDADWGYWEGCKYEMVVGILIAPASETDELDVRVTLADSDDPQTRCEATFKTRYHDLERFAAGLTRMMRREAEEAVLHGRDVD